MSLAASPSATSLTPNAAAGAQVFQLVYVSSATVPFSEQDLVTLLEKSRENNTRAGITGLLLYRDGNFIQLLEGEEEAVWQTFSRINRDPRHAGCIRLLGAHAPQRSFGEWAMGFRNLEAPEVRAMAGFSEFLNADPVRDVLRSGPNRALHLLHTFRRSMR